MQILKILNFKITNISQGFVKDVKNNVWDFKLVADPTVFLSSYRHNGKLFMTYYILCLVVLKWRNSLLTSQTKCIAYSNNKVILYGMQQ